MSQSTNTQATVITCDPCLDIASARGLYGQLQEAVDAGGPVVFRAEQVERIDTAALQVLSVFVREAQARHIAVQWLRPSLPLQQAAATLDLTAMMALPAVAA